MQTLKVDLHTHTAEDPLEKIKYTSFELIDRACDMGYDVLAITNHNTVTYSAQLAEYAEKRGILLLPGMEATFSQKHVLIINPSFSEVSKAERLGNLSKFKGEHSLIVAPHPFYPGVSTLKSHLHKYIYMFDAVEFCHYYNHLVNFNNKAIRTASRYQKPLLGTSDCHNLWQFGKTYSLVQAEKNTVSVVRAIKEGKIEIVTTPLSLAAICRAGLKFFLTNRLRAFSSHFN